MQELNLTCQQSKDLLDQYIKDPITKLHCIESEAIMRALAKHFGENEEKRGIIGLLHKACFCLGFACRSEIWLSFKPLA